MKTPLSLALPLVCAVLTACSSSGDPADGQSPEIRLHLKPVAVGMENLTLPATDWKDVGADTPEHALESFLYARKNANPARQDELTFLRKNYYVEMPKPAALPTPIAGLDKSANQGVSVADFTPTSFPPGSLPASIPYGSPLLDRDPVRTAAYAAFDENSARSEIRGPLNYGLYPASHPARMYFDYSHPLSPAEVQKTDPKQILDVTVLDCKWLSPTQVELDVREHWSEGTNYGLAYSLVPYDFQLDDAPGASWKFVETVYLEAK